MVDLFIKLTLAPHPHITVKAEGLEKDKMPLDKITEILSEFLTLLDFWNIFFASYVKNQIFSIFAS